MSGNWNGRVQVIASCWTFEGSDGDTVAWNSGLSRKLVEAVQCSREGPETKASPQQIEQQGGDRFVRVDCEGTAHV